MDGCALFAMFSRMREHEDAPVGYLIRFHCPALEGGDRLCLIQIVAAGATEAGVTLPPNGVTSTEPIAGWHSCQEGWERKLDDESGRPDFAVGRPLPFLGGLRANKPTFTFL